MWQKDGTSASHYGSTTTEEVSLSAHSHSCGSYRLCSLLMSLLFLLLHFVWHECSNSYCTHWYQISEFELVGTQCGTVMWEILKVLFGCLKSLCFFSLKILIRRIWNLKLLVLTYVPLSDPVKHFCMSSIQSVVGRKKTIIKISFYYSCNICILLLNSTKENLKNNLYCIYSQSCTNKFLSSKESTQTFNISRVKHNIHIIAKKRS